MPTRLVVATTNAGKLEELSRFLGPSTELVSLNDLGLISPEETGRTFLENAVLKAEHASMQAGIPALADDSGLEVDALDGRPGVHSARFAGPDATDVENNEKLIHELHNRFEQPWKARFICAVALCNPEGRKLTALGSLNGRIIEEPRGTNGFGYDPHFEIDDPHGDGFNRMTLAELDIDQKNSLSHRRRAFDALVLKARQAPPNFLSAHLLLEKD